MKKWFGRIISLVALGFVGYFLVLGLDDISASDFQFNYVYFALATIFGFLFYIVRVFGYQLLLTFKGYRLGHVLVGYYLYSSEIIRYIPGNVWGLIARVTKAEKFGIAKRDASLLIIEETVALFLAASFLSGVGLLVVPHLEVFWKVLGVALIISPVVLFYLPTMTRMGNSLVSFLFKNVDGEYVFPLASIVRLFPLYVANWLLYGLAHYFFFLALFDYPTTAVLLTFFSIFAWLAGYASLVTPSGMGVRELVFTISTSRHLPTTLSATFSVVSRIWFTVLELIVFFTFWLLARTFVVGLQKK